MFKKTLLLLILLAAVGAFIWLNMDPYPQCMSLYGPNVCNYYKVMDMAQNNGKLSEMLWLCTKINNIAEKDECFMMIAERYPEACDYIGGYEGVHSMDECMKRAGAK